MRIKESQIRDIIQDSIREEIQNLKEAEKYRDFFMQSLEKAGNILNKDVDSPQDLSDEERIAFFNYVDTKWDEENGEVRDDVDVNLKDMLGESMIRAKVREQIKSFVS